MSTIDKQAATQIARQIHSLVMAYASITGMLISEIDPKLDEEAATFTMSRIEVGDDPRHVTVFSVKVEARRFDLVPHVDASALTAPVGR